MNSSTQLKQYRRDKPPPAGFQHILSKERDQFLKIINNREGRQKGKNSFSASEIDSILDLNPPSIDHSSRSIQRPAFDDPMRIEEYSDQMVNSR